jgi:hypothetical protein
MLNLFNILAEQFVGIVQLAMTETDWIAALRARNDGNDI